MKSNTERIVEDKLEVLADKVAAARAALETFRENIQVEIELGYVLNALVKDWAQPLGVTIPGNRPAPPTTLRSPVWRTA